MNGEEILLVWDHIWSVSCTHILFFFLFSVCTIDVSRLLLGFVIGLLICIMICVGIEHWFLKRSYWMPGFSNSIWIGFMITKQTNWLDGIPIFKKRANGYLLLVNITMNFQHFCISNTIFRQ